MDSFKKGPADFVRATLETSIFTTEQPNLVYHYTTIEGVVGICRSRAIWATDLSYMNDTSEYVYASRIIEEVSKTYAELQPRFAAYEYECHLNPLESGLCCYAVSFCEKKDLLSQWRAYARLGTGYAIEFSWAKLRSRFQPNRLGRVEYVEFKQREILNKILTSLASDASSGETEHGEPFARVGAGFANALLTLRAFLKSPTFQEETEWRLIAFLGADTSEELYRPSDGLLVPYCSLPLGSADDFPITKIVIGPGLHPKAAEESLRRFLDSVGLAGVAIEVSPIPLRI